MTISPRDRRFRLSLASLTVTAAVVSVHHIYRLGVGVVIPAVVLTVLPYLLMRWYRRADSRVALWSYSVLTALIFLWFGFVDGFLDHVMKALGLQHTTLLPGGAAKVVHTAFTLWSTDAGNVFYEGTGLLEFVLSVVAVYYCYRVLQTSWSARSVKAQTAAAAPVSPSALSSAGGSNGE